MALTGDALLEDTLFRHLATLTTTPATTFAWPGIKKEPTKPYVQVQHVPNTARRITIGGHSEYPGFLVCTVVYDEAKGNIKARNIATQVSDHFKIDRLQTIDRIIHFVEPATVGQALPDEHELRLSVSIPYRAITKGG